MAVGQDLDAHGEHPMTKLVLLGCSPGAPQVNHLSGPELVKSSATIE